MIEINKYDVAVDADYKNYFSKGYTVISNDIISCDRLNNNEKVLLIYLIRQYRFLGPHFKVKKWKLEKSIDMSSRRIRDLIKSLKEKCFITEYNIGGGFNGNYEFTLDAYVHLTPHVLLSEIEQNFLDTTLKKLKKKKDFNKAIEVTDKVIKNGLDSEFLATLEGGYKEFLGNKVESSLLDDLEIDERALTTVEEINRDTENFNMSLTSKHSNFIDLIKKVRKDYTLFLLDMLKKELSFDA